MKESTNKTGHSQAGQNKSTEKSSRTTTSHAGSLSSRGTASSQTKRTSRSNNPEGHNQYTKKSETNR